MEPPEMDPVISAASLCSCYLHAAAILPSRSTLVLQRSTARKEKQVTGQQQQQQQVSDKVLLSYAIDDGEKIRGTALRAISQQLPLLEDALCALRHGSYAVTDEYIERVTDALVAARDQLRVMPPAAG